MVKIVGQNEIKKSNKWILLLVSDDYSYDEKLLENASRRCGCVYKKDMIINAKESVVSFHFNKEGGYRRFINGITKSSLYDSTIKL